MVGDFAMLFVYDYDVYEPLEAFETLKQAKAAVERAHAKLGKPIVHALGYEIIEFKAGRPDKVYAFHNEQDQGWRWTDGDHPRQSKKEWTAATR